MADIVDDAVLDVVLEKVEEFLKKQSTAAEGKKGRPPIPIALVTPSPNLSIIVVSSWIPGRGIECIYVLRQRNG